MPWCDAIGICSAIETKYGGLLNVLDLCREGKLPHDECKRYHDACASLGFTI